MSLRIEPWVVAVVELAGRTRLHALALQCHAIAPDGRLQPLEHPPEVVLAPDDELTWRPDDDLAPCKPCTDVVVVGSAWAQGGTPVRRMLARVAVPEVGASASVLVVGDRRVVRDGGVLEFSRPEPFERMPFDWRRAYGGPAPLPAVAGGRPASPAAASELDDEDVVAAFLHQRAARHGHPRNPVGRGWAQQLPPGGAGTDDTGLLGLLPNFEDPDHLLDAASLRSPRPWTHQPLPRGFGWIAPTWFPRSGRFAPEQSAGAKEPGGAAACDHLDRSAAFAWSSGAAPGLAVPWLRGGETIDMLGTSPRGRSLVRLPAPRATRARLGRHALEAAWRIHSVCVDVDRGRLILLWRVEVRLAPALARALTAELDSAAVVDELVLEADLSGRPA